MKEMKDLTEGQKKQLEQTHTHVKGLVEAFVAKTAKRFHENPSTETKLNLFQFLGLEMLRAGLGWLAYLHLRGVKDGSGETLEGFRDFILKQFDAALVAAGNVDQGKADAAALKAVPPAGNS